MKIISLLLIAFCTHSAIAQLSDVTLKSQTVDGKTITTIDSVKKIWNKRVDLTPTHGQTYEWRLGSDTAHYFHPVHGKNFRARVTFYDAAIGLPTTPTDPKPDLITNIDNVDNRNQYSTNWNPFANQPWTQNHFNKTITFTTVTGSSVKITIDGYKFEWWTERRLNHGIASIQIDNNPPVDVDQYEKRTDNNSLLVYTSPELTNGTHTVTITMTGRKNPAWSTDYPAGTAAQNQLRIESQQNNIMHDYIKVYKKQ